MKLVLAFVEDKERLLGVVKKLMNPGGVFVLITPVIADPRVTDKRLRAISLDQKEIDTLLPAFFSSAETYHTDYFEEWGVRATYILK